CVPVDVGIGEVLDAAGEQRDPVFRRCPGMFTLPDEIVGEFFRDPGSLRREAAEVCREKRREEPVELQGLGEAEKPAREAQQAWTGEKDFEREGPPERAGGRPADAGGLDVGA